MRLRIAGLSKSGGREPNEDAFGCWSSDSASFCCVSDGAGGHGGGEVASKLAVRVALTTFQATPDCSAQAVRTAIHAAHEAIKHTQRTKDAVAHMRATAVVLAVDTARENACWGHLGDTRLYCFRDGAVLARTKDHSVVQRMIDAGYLREQDARDVPDRSRLFAALGQDENFVPEIAAAALPLLQGDAFLVCTDGFWSGLADSAMLALLRDARSTEDWLERMERELLSHQDPDRDNYSALAIWCGDDRWRAGDRR